MRRLAAKRRGAERPGRIVASAGFGVGSASVAAVTGRYGIGRRRGFGRMARSPDHPARKSLSEQRLRVMCRKASRTFVSGQKAYSAEGLQEHVAVGEIDDGAAIRASLAAADSGAGCDCGVFCGRLGTAAASL